MGFKDAFKDLFGNKNNDFSSGGDKAAYRPAPNRVNQTQQNKKPPQNSQQQSRSAQQQQRPNQPVQGQRRPVKQGSNRPTQQQPSRPIQQGRPNQYTREPYQQTVQKPRQPVQEPNRRTSQELQRPVQQEVKRPVQEPITAARISEPEPVPVQEPIPEPEDSLDEEGFNTEPDIDDLFDGPDFDDDFPELDFEDGPEDDPEDEFVPDPEPEDLQESFTVIPQEPTQEFQNQSNIKKGEIIMPKNTKIVIPCRIHYAYIWEPRQSNFDDNGPKKYSVCCMIPKSDTATLAKITAALDAAKEDGKIRKWSGTVPSNMRSALRDGDIDKADDPIFEGMYFLNASSKDAPQIVDRNVEPVLDQSAVYSGCYCNVSINFYAYNTKGNRGIAAALCNIQLVKNGDPLFGRAPASSDFKPVEDDDDEDDLADIF